MKEEYTFKEKVRRKAKRFKEHLLYAGVTREEYQLLHDEIQKKNTQMVQYVSFIAVIYLAIICMIFEFQRGDMEAYRMLYRTSFLLAAVYAIAARTFHETLKKYATLAWHILMSGILVYAILLGTVIQTLAPATVFCALLVVLPFLGIDRPIRSIGMEFLGCVIFVILSFHNKSQDITNSDLMNSGMFFVISATITIYAANLKVVHLLNSRNSRIKMQTDEMTGLLNKKAVERLVQTFLDQKKGHGALIVIDLDDFKQINDTMGHEYGDRVICKAADNLKHSFRSSDYIARFGGDEFVVFMTDIENQEVVSSRLDYFKNVMERKLEHLAVEKALQENLPVCIPQSIGVAMYQGEEEDYETLFNRADAALYESKRRGKNCYTFAQE